MGSYLQDGFGLVLIILYFIIITLYLLFRRLFVGRANLKNMEKLLDVSPYAIRCVVKYGSDDRALSSLIVSLAFKGYLEIIEKDSDVLIFCRRNSQNVLYPEEKVFFEELFSGGNEVEIFQGNHTVLLKAIMQAGKSARLDNYLIFHKNLFLFACFIASILLAIQIYITSSNLIVLIVMLFANAIIIIAQYVSYYRSKQINQINRNVDIKISGIAFLIINILMLVWIILFRFGNEMIIMNFFLYFGVIFIFGLVVFRERTINGRFVMKQLKDNRQNIVKIVGASDLGSVLPLSIALEIEKSLVVRQGEENFSPDWYVGERGTLKEIVSLCVGLGEKVSKVAVGNIYIYGKYGIKKGNYN